MDLSSTFFPGFVINNLDNKVKNKIKCNVLNMDYAGECPSICPVCGETLIGHGKRTLEITDTPIMGDPGLLHLRIPRRRCSACKYLWQPKIQYVDENHLLTERAFTDISQKAIKQPFSDVGKEYALSVNTVKSIFIDFLNEKKNTLRFTTPAFLGIDEIKIPKLGEITVITDLEHRTLYDMLEGRNQDLLRKYFDELPNPENVLWVCSDMYRPFEKPIHVDLPKARWVVDHYHVVAYANKAMDSVRIHVQNQLSKEKRIKTKKGLAYTLRTRLKRLSTEEQMLIRECRKNPVTNPIAVAFDLKEEFFDIYDKHLNSKADAQEAFAEWEKKIPKDDSFDGFHKLVGTVHNFYEQIFNLWECPIHITNGFTECTNRLIRENSVKGRGTSFDILRGRTLYRKTNLERIEDNGMLLIGPNIPQKGSIFHYEETKDIDDNYNEDESLYFNSYDYDPFIGLRPGIDYDPETGEILQEFEDKEEVEW